jgi:hypothetical protein
MNTTIRWLTLALVIGLVWQPGLAGTVLGTTGTKCYPTNYSDNAHISVYGDWIENIDRATTNATGVTITILEKQNGIQNNSGEFAGKGKVVLKIKTNNASPGNKTITLTDDPFPPLNPGNTYTFTITIVGSVTVASVDAPTPPDPFKEITVTLNGTGLQQAVDPAQGKIVIDNLVPLVTVGGNATVSSVRVLSSSATSLQAKIFFSALIQDVTVELTLRSTNDCVPLGIGLPFKKNVRVKSANIKNFVESITFPNGSCFDKNSIGTIYINLLFPAPGGGGTSTGTSLGTVASGPLKRPGPIPTADLLQNLYVNAVTNSRVFFKFVPANAFAGVPNGTPINATGFNEVRANAGEDIIPITFKVTDCLGGQPGSTNVVKIQTWMHTTNTNLPPSFVEQTFCVRCTQ